MSQPPSLSYSLTLSFTHPDPVNHHPLSTTNNGPPPSPLITPPMATTTTTTFSYSSSPSVGAGGGGGIPFQQLYPSPEPTSSNYNYKHAPSFQYLQYHQSIPPYPPPPPPPPSQQFPGNWYNYRPAYQSAEPPSWPAAAAAAAAAPPQQPAVLPVGPLPINNNSSAFFVPAGPSAYNYGGEGESPSPFLSLSPRFPQIQQQSGRLQWGLAKEARTHRRLVRQRSAALRAASGQQQCADMMISPSDGYDTAATSSSSLASTQSSSSSTPASFGGAVALATASNTNINFLPANDMGLQRLRFLLQKELRNSDVSHLGRIVLPKREAEMHLPYLEVKGGMAIMVRDVFSQDEWIMKYRFWPNNKSRMYVLENTGEFVKKYRLRCGDFISLYQDEDNQIFICAKKITRISGDEEEDASIDKLVVQTEGSYSDINNDNFIGGVEVQQLGTEGVDIDTTPENLDIFDLSQLDNLPNLDDCDIYDLNRNEKDDGGGNSRM